MSIKGRWLKQILLVGIAAVALAGCEDEHGRDSHAATQSYPHIVYWNSGYRFDQYNRFFEVRDGYLLDEGRTFDIVETECGYDLVLHFVKEEQDGND